jgi:hypothetical protein
MTSGLTIDEIISADDQEIEKVSVPEWGGHVFVRGITADRKDAIDQQYTMKDGKIDLVGYRAALMAACLCDEQGNFSNPTPIQVKALGRKSVKALDRVIEMCRRLNEYDTDEAGELEKNLPELAAESGSG